MKVPPADSIADQTLRVVPLRRRMTWNASETRQERTRGGVGAWGRVPRVLRGTAEQRARLLQQVPDLDVEVAIDQIRSQRTRRDVEDQRAGLFEVAQQLVTRGQQLGRGRGLIEL